MESWFYRTVNAASAVMRSIVFLRFRDWMVFKTFSYFFFLVAGSPERIVAISSEIRPDNSQKGNLGVLDPLDGRVLASIDHESGFYALAASPDRRLVVVGGSDHFIQVLDADSLAVKHRFRAHNETTTTVSFHPKGPFLASGSTDHSIKVWRYEDATLIQEFMGLEGLPRCLAFSPDGRLLATDGRDRVVRILEIGESRFR